MAQCPEIRSSRPDGFCFYLAVSYGGACPLDRKMIAGVGEGHWNERPMLGVEARPPPPCGTRSCPHTLAARPVGAACPCCPWPLCTVASGAALLAPLRRSPVWTGERKGEPRHNSDGRNARSKPRSTGSACGGPGLPTAAVLSVVTASLDR